MKTNLFKWFVGTIFLFLISCPVFAQNGELKNSTPEERAELQSEWMKSTLKLSPSVVPAVEALNLKYAKKTQSLLKSEKSKLHKFKAYKADSDAKDKELRNLLTSDQYKLYQQKKDEMEQKMKQRLKEGRKRN
jgi:hypothetical protein